MPTDVEGPDTCSAHWITTVAGRVVDEEGRGIGGARPQLCVRHPSRGLICLSPPRTANDGAFVIDVPRVARCIASAVMRVILVGSDMTTAYCPLKELPAAEAWALDVPFVLHRTERPGDLPPEGDVDRARTVVLADGLSIDVVPSRLFATGGYEALAARRMPLEAAGLCFLAGAPPLAGLYGLSPEGNVGGAGFALQIPNTTGLPADSEVALYVLGGLGCFLEDGTLLEEAEWRHYANARVSGDGKTIAGASLPCVSWLGYGPIP